MPTAGGPLSPLCPVLWAEVAHIVKLGKVAQKKNVMASHALTVRFPLGQDRATRFPEATPLPFDAYKGESAASVQVWPLLQGANLQVMRGLWGGDGGVEGGRDVNTQVHTLCRGSFSVWNPCLRPRMLMWAYSCPWKPPRGVLAWGHVVNYTCTRSRANSGAPWWSESQPKSLFCFPNGFSPKLWETNTSNVKWEMILRPIGTPSLASGPGLQDWHPESPRVRYLGFFWSRCGLSSLYLDLPKLGRSGLLCLLLLSPSDPPSPLPTHTPW